MLLARRCCCTCKSTAAVSLLRARFVSTEVGPAGKTEVAVGTTGQLTNDAIVKNFFLGKVSKDIVIYPELSSSEDLRTLESMVEPVEKFFLNELDSASYDRNKSIPDDILQQLKDFGLFGQQVPMEYGGLELDATSYARLTEVISLDGSIAVTLAAHQTIGFKGILIAGNEEQKQRYLPRLASGELVAAFCLTETDAGSDANSITTRAELSPEGDHYILNGSKIYISNGGIADLMTVFCKTPVEKSNGDIVDKVSALIVERNFGGVTSGKPEDKLGIRGSNTCEIHFDNVKVPVENLVGEEGSGFKLAMRILNSGRFSMGAGGAGVLKYLLQQLTEHCLVRKQFGKPLIELGLIRDKLATIAMHAYVMESMAYLTAGLLDRYESADLSIESAVVKVYSSDAMFKCTNEALQIMGGQGYMSNLPYERLVRDSRIMSIFEGTNEILRLLIAGSGCQYLAKEGASLASVTGALLHKIGLSKYEDMSPRYHHNVKLLVSRTQEQIHQFGLLCLGQLNEHRMAIVDQQMILARMADCCIDFYAMLCCFSRASRSKSIGLRSADHELDLCFMFAKEANRRLEMNLRGLDSRKKFDTFPDKDIERIVHQIAKNKGYAADHPLTFNWD